MNANCFTHVEKMSQNAEKTYQMLCTV